jgi:U3 small nucleolar RNA-associated protein 14
MVSQFSPITDMELEIQNLIKESGMGQKEVAENEELQLVQISKEEIMSRQKELSKMRALCFYKEQKQKKIAKIKSKVYRKLHRKKKVDDLDLDLEELKRIDPQLAEEKVQKLELERAKERVSLKHKNTSKWAKQMLNRKDNDPETRIALMKQLEKHQQLKKKITGMDSDESDQNGDLENNDNPLNQLDDLENDIDKVEPPLKGLMGMKFMQKGLERQKMETKELIRNVRHLESDDFSGNEGSSSHENLSGIDQKEASDSSDGYASNDSKDFKEEEHQHNIQTSGPITVGNIKQLKPLFEVKPFEIKDQIQTAYFGNVNLKNVAEETDNESSETDKSGLESEHSVDVPQSTIENADIKEEKSDITNPWLQGDASKPTQKSLKGDHLDVMARSVLKLEKHKRKLVKAKDTSMIQLELENDNDYPKENISHVSTDDECNQTEQKSGDLTLLSEDESNSDHDLNVIHSTDINKLSRSDIMRLTFENDNVIEVLPYLIFRSLKMKRRKS